MLAYVMSILILTLCHTNLVIPEKPSASNIQDTSFTWPEGVDGAISFTFDDARPSQADSGLAVLDKLDVQATFYASIWSLTQRIEIWKDAILNGHEIGNHTLTHPCSANFDTSRPYRLEDMDLERMRYELKESNRQLDSLIGTKPQSFAYPCGQTFVGRGTQVQSYIPLVAESFLSGRGWQDESANNPEVCDLSQLMGFPMDNKNFEDLKPILDKTMQESSWLILAGHDMGTKKELTTDLKTLEAVIDYVRSSGKNIWMAPVSEIAAYIRSQRGKD